MANKGMEALKEYHRALKAGEIEKPVKMTPVERAKANPKSMKWAIRAKCYECMNHYLDGRYSCEMPDCSLFSWMPYTHRLDHRTETEVANESN